MSILKGSSQESSSEGSPEWLTTYSDLVTLLLTFFVLLFSMAQIDKQKFEEFARALQGTFVSSSSKIDNSGEDFIKLLDERYDNSTHSDNSDGLSKEQKLENAKAEIKQYLVDYNLSEYITLLEDENAVTLRFDSIILFDLGDAEIKKPGKEVLQKLGDMLKQLEHDIVVQGHTDNLPIETLLYPTNWELSTKRATNVVIFFVDVCGLQPQKFTATGNAEFRPIKPNDTEENRRKNRRIDVVIEK